MIRTVAAIGLAAALLSAPFAETANAASHSRTHRATAHHAKPSRMDGGMRESSRGSSADTSADSLNAQSLTRAQGAQ